MSGAKPEASKLNLLKGSPHKWLTKPIVDYLTKKGAKIHLNHKVKKISYQKNTSSYSVNELLIDTSEGEISISADKYLAACDVPGIKKIIPKEWYALKEFQGINKLRAVAVATIQLRYDGWVTELNKNNTDVNTPSGLNNLLYSADASFSCFADLALKSC